MNILAIDTANSRCSAAVLCGGESGRMVALSEDIGRGHAERLMAMIGEALAEAGMALSDMDRIAVTRGPGSFTGLRVGLAVARGLGLVLDVPVVGISTLAALAEDVSDGRHPVAVALDARNEQAYVQRFAADGTPESEAAVVLLADFAADLPQDAILAGSAAARLAELRGDGHGERVVAEAAAASIEAVARLALRAEAPAAPPAPLYLRAPDAKPQTRFQIARQ